MKRSEQKLIPGPIEGYKIVDENMTCAAKENSFTFQIGINVLPGDEPLKLCNFGFHFCTQPSGPWSYHSAGRLFKVRAYDVLEEPFAPGTDFKMCCARIEFIEEVVVDGHQNTGDRNTGDWNTGNWNTGDRNTGHQNTGDQNTGDQNTGDRNTGNWNTGDRNTGHQNTGDQNTGDRNTGHQNTGHRNTGHRNTGNWNCGNFHSGYFNECEAPLYLFGKICKIDRDDLPHHLMSRLGSLLLNDEPFDPTPFLAIPNATAKKILSLHKAHIEARRKLERI